MSGPLEPFPDETLWPCTTDAKMRAQLVFSRCVMPQADRREVGSGAEVFCFSFGGPKEKSPCGRERPRLRGFGQAKYVKAAETGIETK